MDVRTYAATTMEEALASVKRDMGVDAVILHTREYSRRSWLGLGRRKIVEVVAGRGMNVLSDRRGRRAAPASASAPPRSTNMRGRGRELLEHLRASGAAAGGGALSGSGAALLYPPEPTVDGSGGIRSSNREQFLQTPAAGHAALVGLTRDVNDVKSAISDLVGEIRTGRNPKVPQELRDYYRKLVDLCIPPEIALDLVRTVRLQCRAEKLQQSDYAWERLAEQVEKLLPVAGPIRRVKAAGPHVVALIGPTGVGKTTTLAKLAANLLLNERRRVGLITMDTYRIAAVDQLSKYAEIIGSPIRAVSSLDDLRHAMRSMEDCEFILIDTAGRSPTDTMRLTELRRLLEAAAPDEVHLVLSMTSSQECAELAAQRFGDVRVDKLILTKLDEAANLGLMLNVVRATNRSLSYITNGQNVPDDIEVVGGRRLARLILGGTA
jgi:flagellar biosynthesis protein FlhF